MERRPMKSTLFPYTTLFRSIGNLVPADVVPNLLGRPVGQGRQLQHAGALGIVVHRQDPGPPRRLFRSEEHTSELQSQSNLVCRLLLEKKNIIIKPLDQRNLI